MQGLGKIQPQMTRDEAFEQARAYARAMRDRP